MAIDFSCSCGKVLRAPDDFAGKKARCSACGLAVTVPAPPKPPATRPAPAAAPPARQRPQSTQPTQPSPPALVLNDKDPYADYGLAPSSPTATSLNDFFDAELGAVPASGAYCPSCREPVAANAVLCIRCGYDSRTGKKRQTHVLTDEPPPAGLDTGPPPRSGSRRRRETDRRRSTSSTGGIGWLLFSPDGRIPRSLFWGGMIGWNVVFYGILFFLSSLMKDDKDSQIALFILPLALVHLWVVLCLQIKRWHDRDKSGVWIFINIIPLIGPLISFIELGLLPGTPGNNDFGPAP